MTRKLEELFSLPIDENQLHLPDEIDIQDLAVLDDAIDKIDSALPTVRDLATGDRELDEIANKATETFADLVTLGYNVDSRYAAEILSVASSMLGHALSAKQAKLNKKLKMVELQLRKAKLDLDRSKMAPQEIETHETAEGQLLSRNDLLDRILNHDKKQDS